jgi:hypothetical protein
MLVAFGIIGMALSVTGALITGIVNIIKKCKEKA